jgi:hypothetical protein
LRRFDESTRAAWRYLQIVAGEASASALVGTSQLAKEPRLQAMYKALKFQD